MKYYVCSQYNFWGVLIAEIIIYFDTIFTNHTINKKDLLIKLHRTYNK